MKSIIPEIVSLIQMYSLLGVSRSRYYQLLDAGMILKPQYTDKDRPYYTREMAIINLKVVENNIGVNGKPCVFYRTKLNGRK